MKNEWNSRFENGRPFRLAHQTLCITEFNFETESFVGYTQMIIHPLMPDLTKIEINNKQCEIYNITVNEFYEAEYSVHDPTKDICQENETKIRNLEYFESCHSSAISSVDPDSGNGELTINLPPEILPSVQEMKPFRVSIEFGLIRPVGGIKFVVPDTDGTLLERGAHLFTYNHENSSRLWFPCIDSFSEVCTWKLEFTVAMVMTAVSCGELVETIYTSDLRQKTYHYFMATPTAAPNIALAVGPFEVLVDPNMHEVTHFCLPHLMPILKHTTSFVHEVFEFYEELLSSRYPYTCYKQVFVDMAYDEIIPYATMTICSTNLLHSKKVIDQTPKTRQLLAQAVAQQFFGCFITMGTWCDAWLTKGLSALLCSMYKIKSFGTNAYRYSIALDMKEVCTHELNVGPVILDPSNSNDGNSYFSIRYPDTVSPAYCAIYEKKSHLVMQMLERRIGRELMLQVLNKLLALATFASQQKFTSNTWSNMVITTNSFLKSISTVTGKDVHTFVDQWVRQGGSVLFIGNFSFNRKRNIVELELRQDCTAKNTMKYAGPLTITIQELDGTFNHSFMFEESKTKFEITCHSKSRRQKKKKIPLCTGEEVEMNLDDTDADSPVLWLRVDHDMTILRQVRMEQPDFMWQYMLKYERCVVAQYDAINALESFPTSKTRSVLTSTIENDKCFYCIRIDAANCLTKVANYMTNTSWMGPPAMMNIFRTMFGSPSCQMIVRLNNFSNFQQYYIQKAIPLAMSNLRNMHNVCPPEILQFLLDLFKYNDNTKNKYSDCYYRATLIDALANTVTPAVTTVSVTGSGPSTDALTADTKLILEEVTRYLNLEKLLPCYRLTITVSCLRAIRKLQKFGHLPSDPSLYKSYAIEGNFIDVRLSALEALVDYTAVEASKEILDWLFDLVENDPDPYLRFRIVCMMIKNPPFTKRDSPLNTESLMEDLWRMMTSKFAYDSRLRCAIADLYYTLYGKGRPSCLPPLEDTEFDPGNSRDSFHVTGSMKRKSQSPINYSMEKRFMFDTKVEPSEESNPFKLKIYSDRSPPKSFMEHDDSHSPPPNMGTSAWSSLFPSTSSVGGMEDFKKQSGMSMMPSTSSSILQGTSVPRAEFEVVVKDCSDSMNLSEESSSDEESPPSFKPQMSNSNPDQSQSHLFGANQSAFGANQSAFGGSASQSHVFGSAVDTNTSHMELGANISFESKSSEEILHMRSSSPSIPGDVHDHKPQQPAKIYSPGLDPCGYMSSESDSYISVTRESSKSPELDLDDDLF